MSPRPAESQPPHQPGVCRFCGCTNERACRIGCSWTDETETLCSVCSGSEVLAEMTVRTIGTAAREGAGVPLVTGEWAMLTFDQQHLLVMAARAVLDRTAEALQFQINEEVLYAARQVEMIAVFLAEHFRDELRPGESISTLVVRLLEPHVGARIVLPGGGV